MLAIPATPKLGLLWLLTAVLFALALGGVAFVVIATRRFLRVGTQRKEESSDLNPRSDDPAAFMTASMQAVIRKLREQERELAVVHRAERERAQQTERLSETVTRNMPSGLLLLNAAGLVTSANPAAELILGVRSLRYRRYAEVL